MTIILSASPSPASTDGRCRRCSIGPATLSVGAGVELLLDGAESSSLFFLNGRGLYQRPLSSGLAVVGVSAMILIMGGDVPEGFEEETLSGMVV